MAKDKDPVLDALKQASKGLLFPSESEAPLEALVLKASGDKLTNAQLLQQAGAAKGTAVETTTLETLWRTVPAEDKKQFDKLAKVLREQLSEIKVYKLG